VKRCPEAKKDKNPKYCEKCEGAEKKKKPNIELNPSKNRVMHEGDNPSF
jgi:hypothetical protein